MAIWRCTHLVLEGLLLVADGQVAGMDVQVDVVVTGDAPAALTHGRHALELQVRVAALFPLLTRRGQAVHTPVHVHRPQEGARHGESLQTETQTFRNTLQAQP